MRVLGVLLLTAGMAFAEGEAAGDFDYYVMALSWSPTWCAIEGDRRGSPQCDDDADNGWVLHGLWPQYEAGWPSYCPTNARNPSRADTRDEADLFGLFAGNIITRKQEFFGLAGTDKVLDQSKSTAGYRRSDLCFR